MCGSTNLFCCFSRYNVSTNAFHSTNSFFCFSRYHAPTISVAPSFCILTTHIPQFLDSLRRRANARNVSFRISLRWSIHIINSVDKTKLSCVTIYVATKTKKSAVRPLPLFARQGRAIKKEYTALFRKENKSFLSVNDLLLFL